MSSQEQVNITINGEKRSISMGIQVEELLQILEMDPACVVVELNEDILPVEKRAETVLRDGDSLEVIQFVGGG